MEKNQNKVEMSFVKSTINSLHQVNVMEGVDIFIDDKASDYKVVIPFNAT